MKHCLACIYSMGWFMAGAGLLIGCAQPRPFDDLWVSPRPYHAEQASVRPPGDVFERYDAAEQAFAVGQATGPMTLHDAVVRSLRFNPALKASGWGVAAAEADALQMARPPNPRAGLSIENFAGPDAGEVFQRQTLRLSQVIELDDKRAKRRALGQATERLRAWDYEQLRIEIAATAASRYVQVVVSQRRVELAKQQLALAESGFRIADDRANNGAAPGFERDQAATRVALSKIVLEQAHQQLASDRADLAASWGAEVVDFSEVTGDLESRVDLPTLEALQQRLGQSPQVARWEDELAQRRRSVELARANRVTDPTVGVGLRYFSDADDAAGLVEVSWPLAVFDDNRHGVLAARFRFAQAHAEQEQARSLASQTLARAHARLQAAAYSLKALDEQALPASESAYRAALDAYNAGLTDYLTVLDAERTLLEIRHRRLDAGGAYHRALIEIERTTAQAFDSHQEDDR